MVEQQTRNVTDHLPDYAHGYRAHIGPRFLADAEEKLPTQKRDETQQVYDITGHCGAVLDCRPLHRTCWYMADIAVYPRPHSV